MADPIDPLILTALTRAAAAPGGMPLFASKSAAGLFPATAPGKTAARRTTADGLLSITRDGKPGRELAVVTLKGLDRLLAEANPKPILDDFVRVLELRESQVAEMISAAKEMTEQLAAMKRVVDAVLPKVVVGRGLQEPNPPAPFSERKGEYFPPPRGGEGMGEGFSSTTRLAKSLRTRLESWTATATEDCPLPILFRDLDEPVTIGEFHDALRELQASGEIYLHPWTGPLYALPEPALSLLVGHEVAYYASLQTKQTSPHRVHRLQSV